MYLKLIFSLFCVTTVPLFCQQIELQPTEQDAALTSQTQQQILGLTFAVLTKDLFTLWENLPEAHPLKEEQKEISDSLIALENVLGVFIVKGKDTSAFSKPHDSAFYNFIITASTQDVIANIHLFFDNKDTALESAYTTIVQLGQAYELVFAFMHKTCTNSEDYEEPYKVIKKLIEYDLNQLEMMHKILKETVEESKEKVQSQEISSLHA